LSKTQNNFGTYANNAAGNIGANGNTLGNSSLNQRAQSTGKNFNKNGGIEDNSKSQSYKNRAYINNCKTGSTEYKFNYG
jgi:hypothetical protein